MMEENKLTAGVGAGAVSECLSSRRTFMQSAAAAGAVAALAANTTQAAPRAKISRTLFFNFSDHSNVDMGSFSVFIGGVIYPLTRTTAGHPTLLQARQTNAFLSAVPAAAMTHVLENVQMPADSCSLSYTIADPDPTTGSWSMPHVFFTVPPSALSYAYSMARTNLEAGQPLALSSKREYYGAAPAMTLDDLIAESALVDYNEHASALTMQHPDVLSIEPNSAAHIKVNQVDASASTKALGKKLFVLGAARTTENQGPNGPGWATMTPVTGENDEPLRFGPENGQLNGLIQYNPVINPALGSFLAASTSDASTWVKNQDSLGADISEGIPSAGNLHGKLWSTHNSVTVVNQNVMNLSALSAVQEQNGIQYALVKINDEAGYILTGGATKNGSGLVNIDLKATNSFVRWLALYIGFYDERGNAIPVGDLPLGISANSGLDLPDANVVYLGVITPQFTIFGAPVMDSSFSVAFTWPAQASSARIYASGLGGSGSHVFRNTEVIGIVMTTLFCFVVPAFLLAFAAVPGAELFWSKMFASSVINPIIQEGVLLYELAHGDMTAMYMLLWKSLVKAAVPAVLKAAFVPFFTALLVGIAVLSESGKLLYSASPIAGIIVQIIGMAAIAADIARATHDVAVSPWTYRSRLTVTQDFTVNLAHDTHNDKFPETATHYIATAVFDDGQPHAQTLPMPAGIVTSLPPLQFRGVPVGGKVNVLVAFYADSGWQAGQGETGLLENTPSSFQTAPTITLTQNQVPIGPGTTYLHQSVTALDAGGNRVWNNTAQGPTGKEAGNCENAPGQLCSFRKITVRQGNAVLPGNVGYAWGAYSANVQNCAAGGQGQLDQMANIGTINPQGQYAATSCGLDPGVKLSYNLQGNAAANFYLDSTSKLMRQVSLNPPQFTDPRQKQAYGMLNLDSTDLLLHPGGKVVSVNAANHKLESLRPAASGVPDEEAAASYAGELYSGQGNRPGLMHTPTAAAITAHGVVLVLEAGNSRISALDTCANPVPLFNKQSTMYFLPLSGTDSDNYEYLDMAVEYSGFIYVLTRNINTSVYQLDIYHPNQSDQKAVSKTLNINAARIAVDLWRNVYTLNYEVLKMPDGSFPAVTEPTVSLWTPSNPNPPKPRLLAEATPAGFSAPRPLRRRELFRSLLRTNA